MPLMTTSPPDTLLSHAGPEHTPPQTSGPDELVDATPRLAEMDEGLRSRKKQRTRNDLMAAGAHLFSTNGFDETTTADIAELADVSQRTLFRHFPTKEALLYGDLEEARLELRTALNERPVGEPVLTGVIEALLSLSENHERNRERRLLQARLAARYPSVSAHSRSVVQAGWEREIIVSVADRLSVDPMVDPRPEIIAGAAMSATRVATRQWTADQGGSNYMSLLATALRAMPDIAELA